MKKRNFILATAAAVGLLTSYPAFAIGGNDPMPGIDIIIKRDPGSQPIKPLSLGEGQLGKLSEMRSKEGAQYLGEIIKKHIMGSGVGAGKAQFKELSLTKYLSEFTDSDKLPEAFKFKFGVPDSEVSYNVLIKTQQKR